MLRHTFQDAIIHFGEKMLEKLKEHKLPMAAIVIVGCLIFYAVDSAISFFANPAFRVFWIISDEAAHSVAIYAAIASAVAGVIIGLTVTLIKKRKTAEQQITDNPNISGIKATNQISIRPTFPTNMPKMNDKTKEVLRKKKTTQNKYNSANCHFHFGYLSERERKEKIPDECTSCEEIVECICGVCANES